MKLKKKKFQLLLKKKTKINNIFYSGEDSNFIKLCKDFSLLQQKMNNIQNLCIKAENIVKTIDLDLIDEPIMVKEREIFLKKFEQTLEIFKYEVNRTREGDLKRALFLCFRNFKNKILDNYSHHLLEADLGEIDEDDESMDKITAEVLLFTNIISNMYEDFRKKIEKDIDVKLNTYNNEYNKFKRCSNCGIIWFKIKGCNRKRCGNRTRISDKLYGIFKNYKVKFMDNKIEITKEDLNQNIIDNDSEFWGLSNEEKADNEKRVKNGKAEIKPIGCGQSLNWATMEDCSEEVIKQLKEDSLKDDFYSDSIELFDKLAK